MTDPIMVIGSMLFFILFLFLSFVFIVYVLSLFIRRSFETGEPAVSIIIPAHNEEKNIASCIQSVFRSDYPAEKMEVIVVDDGSDDDTANIAERFHVKMLRQKHAGKSQALNTGTHAARYDLIMTLDSDCTIERQCLRALVQPFADPSIGASTGISTVKNNQGLLGMFQNIEYHYNNLIKNSFSHVFNNGIWFFGAIACYRARVLKEIGYFKRDTLTEDMDIALEIKKAGYKTFNVKDAAGQTIVPDTVRAFYKQRSRWWMGVLQALVKNKVLFNRKASPAVLFLFVNQFWWSFYALVSLPLIIYQVNYWLPYNSESILSLSGYLFRWFSLSGPLYVIYKIPEWGLSLFSVFGVLAGIISAFMIVSSIFLFKDTLRLRNLVAIFFYFPYTIGLNMVTFISLLGFRQKKIKYFLK